MALMSPRAVPPARSPVPAAPPRPALGTAAASDCHPGTGDFEQGRAESSLAACLVLGPGSWPRTRRHLPHLCTVQPHTLGEEALRLPPGPAHPESCTGGVLGTHRPLPPLLRWLRRDLSSGDRCPCTTLVLNPKPTQALLPPTCPAEPTLPRSGQGLQQAWEARQGAKRLSQTSCGSQLRDRKRRARKSQGRREADPPSCPAPSILAGAAASGSDSDCCRQWCLPCSSCGPRRPLRQCHTAARVTTWPKTTREGKRLPDCSMTATQSRHSSPCCARNLLFQGQTVPSLGGG